MLGFWSKLSLNISSLRSIRENVLLKRSGLLLACATLLLQFAVYLQPLLPEQYHIAPVCLSITHNLLSPKQHQHVHASYHALIDHLGPNPAIIMTIMNITINASTVPYMVTLFCHLILVLMRSLTGFRSSWVSINRLTDMSIFPATAVFATARQGTSCHALIRQVR